MNWSITATGVYVDITPTGTLDNNTEYTVTILAGLAGIYNTTTYTLASDYSFWFTSTYCPLFTTLSRVKYEVGAGSDALTDDAIYRLIHKNSMDALDHVSLSTGVSLAYDYYGCDWSRVPYVLRRYVECKTAYDILAILDLAGSELSNIGQTKTLGDMTIRYDRGGPATTGPAKKKQLYDCMMEMLDSIKATEIQPAVRGFYDTSKQYPHPVFDQSHNRIVRTVDRSNSHPAGPWERARDWTMWE